MITSKKMAKAHGGRRGPLRRAVGQTPAAAVKVRRLAVFQGAMAMTLKGLPEPPTIFSGAATTMAPVGGS